MTKFKNKYRIKSNRMPDWDYAGNGIYFITMVTQNREWLFGNIKNSEMFLSDFGKIAEQEWYKSFEIRNELILDEFVIMPNHLHTIVIIKKTDGMDGSHGLHGFPGFPVVETHGRASLQSQQSQFYRKPKSLSSFIAGYKSAVTTQINNWIDNHEKTHGRASLPDVINDYVLQKYNRKNKLWQPNYHDHIIRNNDEYWPIKNYIKNNPNNWSDDTFHKI